MIDYTCPNCGSTLHSRESPTGETGACPECGHDVQVPSPQEGRSLPQAEVVTSCPQCGTAIGDGNKFCTSCGAQLGNAPAPPTAGRDAPHAAGQSMTTREFQCAGDLFGAVVNELAQWLTGQQFDCQRLVVDDGRTLLQVVKQGRWRKLIGMSTALNVVLGHAEDVLTAEIGAGRWVDKAVAGGISLFVLWPLAVTAGIGAWEQLKLPDRIFDFIAQQCEGR